jgi:hypothetical protein
VGIASGSGWSVLLAVGIVSIPAVPTAAGRLSSPAVPLGFGIIEAGVAVTYAGGRFSIGAVTVGGTTGMVIGLSPQAASSRLTLSSAMAISRPGRFLFKTGDAPLLYISVAREAGGAL